MNSFARRLGFCLFLLKKLLSRFSHHHKVRSRTHGLKLLNIEEEEKLASATTTSFEALQKSQRRVSVSAVVALAAPPATTDH